MEGIPIITIAIENRETLARWYANYQNDVQLTLSVSN